MEGSWRSKESGPWSVILRLCRSQSWIEKAVASRCRGLALVPLSVLPVPSGVLETLVFPTQLLVSNYQSQCNSYVAHLICSRYCAGQFCCGGRRTKILCKCINFHHIKERWKPLIFSCSRQLLQQCVHFPLGDKLKFQRRGLSGTDRGIF